MARTTRIARNERESAPEAVQMAVFVVSMVVVAIAVFYCATKIDAGAPAYASDYEVPGIAIVDAASGTITGPANAIAVKDAVAVTHLQCTRNHVDGSRPVLAISGSVVNNAAAAVNGVAVSFAYYDEAGREIGRDTVQAGKLAAGTCRDLALVSSLDGTQAFDAAYFDVVGITTC